MVVEEDHGQNRVDLATIVSNEQLNINAPASPECGSRPISPAIIELSAGSQPGLNDEILAEVEQGSTKDMEGDEFQEDEIQIHQNDIQAQLSGDHFSANESADSVQFLTDDVQVQEVADQTLVDDISTESLVASTTGSKSLV
ncbi:hypothetical protein V6N11_001477 [Hibiscus sabdariffa]|uniref:Uncharacterized protein n=1 Tax=Hibiscus sabdariffa TaxID=183260 RepID=A0ABR2S0L0_9ROSI